MTRKIEQVRFAESAPKKKRVAAYARVSSGKDAMLHSLSAQVSYYSDYIQNNGWEYAGVYADKAITGTKDKRESFQKLLAECRNGNVDMVITKSISRFARNTVTLLTTVLELKDAGVEVFFQKENIFTLDSKGELLITIMSSLAQEESRSISENVTWGQRKSFSDGKVKLPYKRFLGYRKGADGTPEIVPEEAEIILRIYSDFISGKAPSTIAKELTRDGILTPGGKTEWEKKVVLSILTNEKYKGAALLQKRYTVDFLQKKTKVNEGEVPQYYVENSHPAIIEPEEWDRVQIELARPKPAVRLPSATRRSPPRSSAVIAVQGTRPSPGTQTINIAVSYGNVSTSSTTPSNALPPTLPQNSLSRNSLKCSPSTLPTERQPSTPSATCRKR